MFKIGMASGITIKAGREILRFDMTNLAATMSIQMFADKDIPLFKTDYMISGAEGKRDKEKAKIMAKSVAENC